MDDFTRYYKILNGVPVKLTYKEGDQDAQYLNIVEDSLGLDAKIISHIRSKLEETKLRAFVRSNDTIIFNVDGFLGSSWGFMYCKQGLRMDTIPFNFRKNNVIIIEDVNKNWEKISIE